jgi:hypothetical protein
MSRKPSLGDNIAIAKLQIARRLRRGEPIPAGLAKNLADLLAKAQRNYFGRLQNARRRGELR